MALSFKSKTMFKKIEEISKEADDVQTLIGPSIEVSGDFVGGGDVIVEGKLSGTLKTEKDLRIGPNAKIEADVEAENIFVAGEIIGNIKARTAIELSESSMVRGDIETKSLVVEKGATLNGSCSMTDEKNSEQEANSKKNNKSKKGKLDGVVETYRESGDNKDRENE